MKKISVIGCTGRTGRQTSERLMELMQGQKEMRLVLAGRDKLAMERLSTDLGRRYKNPVDVQPIDFNDRGQLRLLCDACEVVVNCAGPYAVSGPAVLATAIVGKAHLIDAANEPTYLEQCAARDSAAREAGVAVVNGVSFSPGIADLAADVAAKGWQPVNAVHVLNIVQNLEEGTASRQSFLEMVSQPTRSFVDRRLQGVAFGSKKHSFRWPGGQQNGVISSGGEIFTLPRHIPGIRDIYVYQQFKGLLGMFASLIPNFVKLPQVKKWAREGSTASSDGSACVVIVEMEADKGRRFAVVQAPGYYNVTAKLLAHAAMKLATDGPKAKGVLSPASAFDPQWLLKAAGLEVQTADA